MGPARLALAASAALLLTACVAGSASAAWPNVPGVNVQVANTGINQDPPIVVPDGQGGAFYLWNELSDIRAQHLTAQGLVAPGWPATGVPVTSASGAQYLTDAVADGFGGVIAVWDDYRNGHTDIYSQRIGPDGSALWAVGGAPVCGMPENQYSARLCADRTGGAVYVWSDLRDGIANFTDLYAQRLSSTGTLRWAGGAIAVCALPQDQIVHSIISDGTSGGAIFLWRDFRTVGDPNIYAQRFDPDGFPRAGWAPNGNGVCTFGGDQAQPSLASDGAFGCYAAWNDYRSSAPGVYVQRLTPLGSPPAGWTANGVIITTAPYAQDGPVAMADGAGGAIVCWNETTAPDFDIFAQRIGPNAATSWTAGGIPVANTVGEQYAPKPVSDGAGGAVVAFTDTRAGQPPALYAQRITSAGAVAPGWALDGHLISDHWVLTPSIASDGIGGALLGWQRNGPGPQAAFAQRVDPWGYLGVQPDIASVADVPNDQGGRVKLSWDRSPLDVFPNGGIADYLVFRSVPPNVAQAALARGEARLAGATAGDARRARRTFTTTVTAGATTYWEHLATVPALHLAGYSHLAATEQDSTPDGSPRTLFMVRAQNADASRFWDSDPDSAYSVDNLPPAGPAPFAAAYASGATNLHWGANAEPDFALYRLYRGPDASFVPNVGNRIVEQPDTGYVDVGPAGRWYKLTAVDAHGNESVVSIVGPNGTVDAPVAGELRALALAAPFPNPAPGSTTCRFTLPAAGAVRLEIYDASGRRVRQLVAARLPAGEHAVLWDGRDDSGARTGGGLYFARLASGNTRLSSKFVMLD